MLHWDHGSRWQDAIIEEAKRRGFTPQTCAEFLGRDTGTAIADEDLCKVVTRKYGDTLGWETDSYYRATVTNAKRRGLTLERCASLVGS